MISRTKVTTIGALLVAVVAPASAQVFGQWWWSAGVGFRQESYETEISDRTTSEFERDELHADATLGGFIIHPRIASFRATVGGWLSNYDTGVKSESTRYNLALNTKLFPYGSYPGELSASYHTLTLKRSEEGSDDPIPLVGLAQDSFTLRGALQVRGGPFRGASVGVQVEDFRFAEAGQGSVRSESLDLQWATSGDRSSQSYRLERRTNDYGGLDFETDQLLAYLSHARNLGSDWTWSMTGYGLQSETAYRESRREFENYVIRNTLTRSRGANRQVQVAHDSTAFGVGGALGWNHNLTASYSWTSGPWSLAPFASYNLQDSQESSLRSPRVGGFVTWTRRGWVDLAVQSNASWGRTTGETLAGEVDRGVTTYGGSVSLSGGSMESLRTRLSAEFIVDDLTVRDEPFDVTPGLEPSLLGGTTDRLNVQLNLGRRFGSLQVLYWVRWREESTATDLVTEDVNVQTLSHSLGLTGPRFSLTLNAGKSAFDYSGSEGESSFTNLLLGYRPLGSLWLKGSYRLERRDLITGPEVDIETVTGSASISFLGLFLSGSVFRTDSTGEALSYTTYGVSWSIGARFSGLLPIISAPERRGVIR